MKRNPYSQLSSYDDEDCRRTSAYPYDLEDSPSAALLDDGLLRTKHQDRRGRLPYCKAVAFVMLACAAYILFRVMDWGFSPEENVLDDKTDFGTALGCFDVPSFYLSSEVVRYAVPLGEDAAHALDVHGDAAGSITLAVGDADATEVMYELSLRTNNTQLLDLVSVRRPQPELGDDRMLFTTVPLSKGDTSCARFDMVVRVPPNLKKLHVASHSTTHVRFAPGAEIRLETLFVTLFDMDSRNRILPDLALQADAISLEVYSGGILGAIAVVDKASLKTQRGDGHLHIDAHPVPRGGDPVSFSTLTGEGSTNITWIGDSAAEHRPIRGTHISSRGGDVRLDYRSADFEGLVQLDSKTYSASALQAIEQPRVEEGSGEGGMPSDPRWTHYAGDREGEDRLYIESSGWTGLYI
ncbi:uncharacterized protein SCHCODRAFT_085505 [Schizophyllum commune H4-8]|uniref:Expressed protein n=1 Tax=Schizophyllum commune (strain H4-8 / FGSC 9210) TaxID=578458 RepID=D8Q8X4_SCHCM|nr:uncharacterized protein SCHCODRAFT_085505 [Schizophyllum commune H4-8]KAI5890635.1 hypothetical protein SCHCODRAFT_085505 [Schizophyllum commune H4-8]